MFPSAATILASVITFAHSTLAVDHCTPPGEYMCAVLVSADLLAFPNFSGSGASISAYNGIEIVNGNCDSIHSSGDLGAGFYGDFWTTYGTELKFWAKYISAGEINGINFLYDGNWYYEPECTTKKWGFDPAGQTQQCNFAC